MTKSEYKHLPPMLLLATLRATRFGLKLDSRPFPPCSTSKVEDYYGERSHRHIEWLYMALQRPKLSTKQQGTTCRELYGLAHMLTRLKQKKHDP